ncbi:hypothetical protein K3495_g4676 [Podosphaera aphanis]|nr:hypothetical protein K3495_g4676 [Podosphaera aphanis]
MSENPSLTASSVNANNDIPGLAYYEKSRKQLRELIQKRRELELALASHEELIAKKEQEYLEETPSGNIIAGFDSYTKGGTVTGRKRGREEEERERRLRVFSRSSISWNANAAVAATPTHDADPKMSHDGGHPGSAAQPKSDGLGALARKNKKGPEDSEGEGRDPKKARVCFGAARK